MCVSGRILCRRENQSLLVTTHFERAVLGGEDLIASFLPGFGENILARGRKRRDEKAAGRRR